MKEIIVGENWWAADIETTGFLEQFDEQDNPKVWVLARKNLLTGESSVLVDYSDIQEFLSTSPTLSMHNGHVYDIPVLRYFGFDVSKVTLIDSLMLSWYLEPSRKSHGLAAYGEFFGILKPEVADWEGLTQDEYNHRCLEDCEIQYKLFYRQKEWLEHIYSGSGGIDKLLGLLRWKGEQQAMQQENRWAFDSAACIKLIEELESELLVKTDALFKAMPNVEKRAKKKKPKKPFLASGELSATGLKWSELVAEAGFDFDYSGEIDVVTGYEPPNPQSPQQVKDWLYSYGWIPTDFKYIREDSGQTRKIPQVNLSEGKISSSVLDLADKLPAVEYLAGLGVIKHRLGMCKGFLKNAYKGELKAANQGLTNTLRLQHKELVNLPSSRALYGEAIRSMLVARDGLVLLGSDLSSLEDRIKHHFQFPLDSDYVNQQLDKEFDPHLLICVSGGLMSQDDSDWYKDVKAGRCEKVATKFSSLDKIRGVGKGVNYSSQYGAGVETVARTAKVSKSVAKNLLDTYRKLNWTIDKIASMTLVQKDRKYGDWQYNPISKLWYSLRSDKDRFSTLVQGSGAYIFDCWLYLIKQNCEKAGVPFKLLGQFHDEFIAEVEVGMEGFYEKQVKSAIHQLSEKLALNRGLDCDVDFGKNYAEIH